MQEICGRGGGRGAGEDGGRERDVAAVVNTIRILLMCGGRPHLGRWPVALGEGTLIISELEKRNGTQNKKTFCVLFCPRVQLMSLLRRMLCSPAGTW